MTNDINIGFGQTNIGDSESLTFGTDDDYTLSYDSTDDEVVLNDTSTGNDVLRMGPSDIEVPSGNIVDGLGNIIYDQSNNWIPESRLENNSITITAGDGLKGGGTPTLGGSTTVNIEPADFAGAHLSDDGADNLAVDDDFVLNSGDTMTGALDMGSNPVSGVTSFDASGQILFDPTSGSLTDGGSVDSNVTKLRGYYDSDGTTSITATSVDADIQHVANSDGSSVLDTRVQTTDVMRAHSSGLVDIPNGNLRLATGQAIEDGGGNVRTRLNSGNLVLNGQGLVDLSLSSSDLRLATGQSIEDGSGNTRMFLGSSITRLYDETGTQRMLINSNGQYRFDAKNGSPWVLYDGEGGFEAVQYTTSTSTGTLELTNAAQRMRAGEASASVNADRSLFIGSQDATYSYAIEFQEGDANSALIYNNNGELVGEDSAGNTSTLT